MKELSENLQNCLELATKALISNKEDTELAITIIGDITTENNNLKKDINGLRNIVNSLNEVAEDYKQKQVRANIIVNTIIPVATIPMIVSGAILMAGDNDLGKPVFYTGTCLFVSCEIVWNCGHLVFRVW